MEARIAHLEGHFDGLDKRLDRIESNMITKWDIAQVVFYVVGALMVAAIFGSRFISLLAL